MSKLPNAPLVEVIFEIKWQIINQNDIVDFQYLHGDLYSVIKSKYPARENLIPPEIPVEALKGKPFYRYRSGENNYPLVQLGPGVLSINNTDEDYYWDTFEKEIDYLLDSFVSVYPKSNELKFTPSLTYIDFFEIDFEKTSSLKFINENFNLNITQSFLSKENISKELNLMFSFEINDKTLVLEFKHAMLNQNKKGIVLQTKIVGQNIKYSRTNLSEWINESHNTTRKVFMDIVREELYETFK